MENIYAVIGATGKTGHVVAETLLEKGKKVIAIGKNEEKLKIYSDRGAKVIAGDILDRNFLINAFREAAALYAMIPPNYQGNDYLSFYRNASDSILSAIKENRIRYVVALSSMGAELSEGTGVVVALHYFEERLKELDNVNVLILRGGYFMENFFSSIDMIKNMGLLGSSTKGDVPIPMVYARDIGEVAARHLLELDFKGITVKYVLGQRDLTFNEATKILGKAIGKDDLQYVQFSYEDAKNGMIQSGLPENTAEGFVGLSRYLNSGAIKDEIKRTQENTTHTSFEEFSRIFAAVYNS